MHSGLSLLLLSLSLKATLGLQSQLSFHHGHYKVERSLIRSSVATSLSFKLSVSREETEVSIEEATNSLVDARAEAGKASIPNLTTSLVKSLVGSGIFALPSGLAAMGAMSGSTGVNGGDDSVVVAATAIVGLTGAMNAYFFALLGSCCELTGTRTYGDAWDVANQRTRPGVLVPFALVLKTILSCLAFSIILADSYQSLAGGLLGWEVTRTQALLSVTVTTVAPLCLLKDLKALAPFSALGIAGISITVLGMVYRWLDGSYGSSTAASALAEGGGAINWSGTLILACTLTTAFMAHYNAPRFYAELENPTPSRWNIVVYSSYGIAAMIFALVGVTGYQTFGSATQGFILNNYRQDDSLMTLARLALAISITVSYPLPFVGMRDSVLQLLSRTCNGVDNDDTDDDEQKFLAVTLGLLTVVTAVAIQVEDLALIATIGGGTFSTLVASVFPALLYRGAIGNNNREIGLQANLTMALMAISVVIGLAGVTLALNK